jgi:hypothetical protein
VCQNFQKIVGKYFYITLFLSENVFCIYLRQLAGQFWPNWPMDFGMNTIISIVWTTKFFLAQQMYATMHVGKDRKSVTKNGMEPSICTLP